MSMASEMGMEMGVEMGVEMGMGMEIGFRTDASRSQRRGATNQGG